MPQTRSTHELIAKQAGVSIATVDRVLNQRGSVTEEKSRRVVEAAIALGFGKKLPELWHAHKRIELILPKNATPFWASLETAFLKHAASLPRHFILQRTHLKENDPEVWKKAILQPAAPRSALIIAADGGAEMAPILSQVMARGETVVTLTTEVPGLQGHSHSGIDNMAVGRTAGRLMRGLLRKKGVLAVLPPHERRVEHSQRIAGFREIVGADYEVQVHPTNDLSHRLSSLVTRLLDQQGVIGIYDTGQNSIEIGETLKRRPDRPIWIAHEKSEVHQKYLREDVLDFVLDQDPEAQAARALFEVISRDQVEGGVSLVQRRPELRIYCRENL